MQLSASVSISGPSRSASFEPMRGTGPKALSAEPLVWAPIMQDYEKLAKRAEQRAWCLRRSGSQGRETSRITGHTVVQVDLVINLKTSKMLGLTVCHMAC